MVMQVPGFLRAFWRGWRALALKIAHFNGVVVLTILYWGVIAPVSILFALGRQDPLRVRLRSVSDYCEKHLRTDPHDYRHIY
jgi:hypothetical protein